MKLYEQQDAMDCGPTCLRMIARHYGKNYSIQELRSKSFINREGVSLLGISDAAESIGFKTIAIKISFEIFAKEAPLPCIVHWNQSHFVVVYKVSKNKIWIADPMGQKVVLPVDEFLKSWGSIENNGSKLGIALLVEPTPTFYERTEEKQELHKNSLRYLFSYLRQYRKFIVQLFIGLLVGSVIQLIVPFLTQSIVDVGIKIRDVNFIYLLLAGQLMLFVSRTTVDFIRQWILLHLSTRINISIISDFLMKLMQLPLSFFDSKTVGDLLQRIDDHSRIQEFLSSSTLNILFSFVNLIVFGLVLMIYHIPIFLIFAVGSIVYFLYVFLFLKKRRELDYRKFNQMSANHSSLIQLIGGMPEIKLNGAEKLKRWEWERIQAKLFKVNVDSTRLLQFQESGSLFVHELKNIFITFMAATAVIEGEMTLGMMLAVQYIIGQLNVPITEAINFVGQWQDAKISLERIGEIHGLANEEGEVRVDRLTASESRDLIIKDLTFRYTGPESPKALNKVSMIIPAGKVTAIVGTSGSGKTTLLKLLLKMYDPVDGEIFHGNSSLKYISSREWRKKCGVVMQEGYIFSDTIAKNIALGDEYPDRDRLIRACQVANIHSFIEELPIGYDTKIGQEGVGLSQGQKQRLLIARAVYKNPSFLFFDEATSSLDTNNERIIMENLNEFYKGRTVIVIAHRLSTVKNADQIIVMEKGRITECGDHTTLIQQRGNYFELVKNQLELAG